MSEKYALIAAEKADPASPYKIVKMCGCSRCRPRASTTTSTPSRPTGTAAGKRSSSTSKPPTSGRGCYGVRRVHAVLQRCHDPEVASVSVKLVRSVMAELGLSGCQSRAYKTTTRPDPDAAAAPADLVGRDFTADAPGVKLVGDITYVRVDGWLYLATVIDCRTREVIGWSMAEHMRPASSVTRSPWPSAAVRCNRSHFPFGPRKPIYERTIRHSSARPSSSRSMGKVGSMLGQRARRVVLCVLEERAGLPDRLRHKTGPSGRLSNTSKSSTIGPGSIPGSATRRQPKPAA